MEIPAFWETLQVEFRDLLKEAGDDAGTELDDGGWVLQHETKDKSRSLKFRDLATRAAQAAGVQDGADPVNAWLTRLKTGSKYESVSITLEKLDVPVTKYSGWVTHVIQASIERCGVEITEALARQRAPTNPTTWKDITITFMTDFQVQIVIGAEPSQNFDFTAMGFVDRRNGTPTKAWEALRILAEKGGTLDVDYGDRKTIESRIKELRQILRAHFKQHGFGIPVESDPLPYKKHILHSPGRYVSAFTIRVSPSYSKA